jgi:hypothetical protein
VREFGRGKEKEAEYDHREDFPIIFGRKSVRAEKGDS